MDGATHVDLVYPATDGFALAYAADLLRSVNHPLASTIKPRTSKNAAQTYLSNGCLNCDALFGQFFLNEDVVDVLAADAVATRPVLTTVSRPSGTPLAREPSKHHVAVLTERS